VTPSSHIFTSMVQNTFSGSTSENDSPKTPLLKMKKVAVAVISIFFIFMVFVNLFFSIVKKQIFVSLSLFNTIKIYISFTYFNIEETYSLNFSKK
jgi:antibiotic biosynthesis monooxygenase (ABM) superfamily enzyme